MGKPEFSGMEVTPTRPSRLAGTASTLVAYLRVQTPGHEARASVIKGFSP
jgi:hypothetical protein